MSLPAIMSLDRMAVRAPHLALVDLALCLRDALCSTDVVSLVSKVVKVQRVRMSPIPAVNATRSDFECVQPSSGSGRAFIGYSIHALPVARLFKASGAPFFNALLRDGRANSGPVLTERRAKLRHSFGRKRGSTLSATKRLFNNRFPRFHMPILPDMYPCKPDIFAATYDAEPLNGADNEVQQPNKTDLAAPAVLPLLPEDREARKGKA